ncbi:MAG: hypothetical protein AAF798_09405 [Bacteroidota bacterium]
MRLLRTLPYVFLIGTLLVAASALMGFDRELKTFGISGTIKFEDASAKGAQVVLTTSDEDPFSGTKRGEAKLEQYLQQGGQFYRKINQDGGMDVYVWIRQEGYPIIQVRKGLITNFDQVDFEEIVIPANLKVTNSTPVEFFKEKCDEGSIVSVFPNEIRIVRDFKKVSCDGKKDKRMEAKLDIRKHTTTSTSEKAQAFASELYFSAN